MALYPTGNQTFDSGVQKLELTRQNAEVAAQALSTFAAQQAALNAAAKAYWLGVIALGAANGVSTQSEQQALAAINSTGAP
jgi:hypothetical protein